MKIDWKTCLRVGVSAFLLYLCIQYWQNVAGAIGAVFGALYTKLFNIFLFTK